MPTILKQTLHLKNDNTVDVYPKTSPDQIEGQISFADGVLVSEGDLSIEFDVDHFNEAGVQHPRSYLYFDLTLYKNHTTITSVTRDLELYGFVNQYWNAEIETIDGSDYVVDDETKARIYALFPIKIDGFYYDIVRVVGNDLYYEARTKDTVDYGIQNRYIINKNTFEISVD